MDNILLIDDDSAQLSALERALSLILANDGIFVGKWYPAKNDGLDAFDEFNSRLADDTLLVVTDYQLSGAQTGLFGAAIVSWAQARLTPVGDFTRGPRNLLPSEPNLFELRIPPTVAAGSQRAAELSRGFRAIRDELSRLDLGKVDSPARALAAVLGRPTKSAELSLYFARATSLNSSLFNRVLRVEPSDEAERGRLTAYVIGHVLANAILRFPGPILDTAALCAFLGLGTAASPVVEKLFAEARYSGPFAESTPYFWLSEVESCLAEQLSSLGDVDVETLGELNRLGVEALAGKELPRHDCARCHGQNGGFWCPLTKRAVCQRPDCSVAASGWVPAGARICRVERDFYDEWRPVLGF